jgi:tRNA A-37 threonylcarbamoyl transferase component Bud32
VPVESFVKSLMRPVKRLVPRRPFLAVHPEWRERLSDLGLHSVDDFLLHPGEIVSGHPDRHVMRTTFGTTTVYLKREHRVPMADRLASWRAGFGFVSVSCREAETLRLLSDAGLPAPEWIAAGEDGRGRAFLVLKSVEGAKELRRYLLDLSRQPLRQRRIVARRLGGLIAAVHDAGFAYPDLSAKHVFVDPTTNDFTLLDWQRSWTPHPLSWHQRSRDLAALNASLAEELAAPADRLTFLLAYLRATSASPPSFGTLCRMIEKRTAKLLKRSSIHEQRLPAFHDSQPLVWLGGEALAVTPICHDVLSHDDLSIMAYALPSGRTDICETGRVVSSDGRTAELTRRRSVRRFGRLRDAIRGRRWTAPESREAADLLRSERLGESARLLAFGQRERSWGVVESFLLRLIDDERWDE